MISRQQDSCKSAQLNQPSSTLWPLLSAGNTVGDESCLWLQDARRTRDCSASSLETILAHMSSCFGSGNDDDDHVGVAKSVGNHQTNAMQDDLRMFCAGLHGWARCSKHQGESCNLARGVLGICMHQMSPPEKIVEGEPTNSLGLTQITRLNHVLFVGRSRTARAAPRSITAVHGRGAPQLFFGGQAEAAWLAGRLK